MQELVESIDILQQPNNSNTSYHADDGYDGSSNDCCYHQRHHVVAQFVGDDIVRVSADEIINYLEKNKRTIREVICQQTLDDDGMERFLAFWNMNYGILHLRRLCLPKNNHLLTVTSIAALSATIQTTTASELLELDLSDNHTALLLHQQGVGGDDGLALLVSALTEPSSYCRLTHLNLSKNGIGSKKGLAAIGRILHHSNNNSNSNGDGSGSLRLQHLNLSHNSLGPRSMATLAQDLCRNRTLKSLDLSYNKIGDRGVGRIVAALDAEVSECVLEDLDLSFNKIGPKGAEYIQMLLSDNTNNRTMSRLNLSLNVIGPEGANCLRWVVQYNHRLTHLNLSRNNMGDTGVVAIAEGLQASDCTRLRFLDLSWNSLADQGARHLANFLRGNSVLESLKLSSNAIGDEGIGELADALHADLALKELDIVGNQMRDPSPLVHLLCYGSYTLERLAYEKNNLSSDQEARMLHAFQFRENMRTWLSKVLKDIAEKKMISLNLKSKDFGDEEVIAICKQMTKFRPTVTTAFFHSPRFTNRGLIVLARDVLGNHAAANIQRLYIRHCRQLTERSLMGLAKALSSKNCRLQCLTLANCHVGVRGAQALAHGLEENISLTRLSLDSNHIGDLGAKAIFAAVLDPAHPKLVALNLANNRLTDKALLNLGSLVKLEALHLDDNGISDTGALDLAKAVMDCKSIGWLNLRNNCLSTKGIHALTLFLPNELVLESSDQRRVRATEQGFGQ